MEGSGVTKSILNWTIGIAAIAFVLLLMAIIFGNLSGNVGFEDALQGMNIINESAHLNETGYTVSGYNSTWSGITVIAFWANKTSGWTPYLVPAGNYSISSAGVFTNSTPQFNKTEFDVGALSYSYNFPYTTAVETQTEQIIGNYTESTVNTSSQFPTVGTILGVALLILILLALLVYVIVKMSGVSVGEKSGGDFKEGNFA